MTSLVCFNDEDMKKYTHLLLIVAVFGLAVGGASAQINWEAFNDHRTGPDTSPNATAWELRGFGAGGPLKDIASGDELKAALTVEEEGGATDDFGMNDAVEIGSPADLLFAGKCTIGGAVSPGIPGIRNSSATVLRLRFTNLDPSKRYNFRGTTCRGSLYPDRWTVFKVVEAEDSVAAHTMGGEEQNLFTAATYPESNLASDEVALNSGDNRRGSLVGWDGIDPGADGTFAIEARQFIGKAPYGAPSNGPYGYGLTVIYLAETGTDGLGFAIVEASADVDGRVTIKSTARTGRTYAVDVSTDLIQWSELSDNEIAVDGMIIYTDMITEPRSLPRLYYRVRQP